MYQYNKLGPVTIHLGDCAEVLKTFQPDSIDSVVCDPPYGLKFMGKAWDHGVPSAEVWKEVLRVLKPGGHLLAFAGSRTYHRMAVNIEDAGFEIRDQIMWVYGSGFPKSLDISKALDSHPSARQWDGWGTALKPAHEPIVVARKPLVGTVAANVLSHGVGGLNIDGCRVPTEDNLNGGAYSQQRQPSTSDWAHQGITIHKSTGVEYQQPLGRFPANLIHDGSDKVLDCFPDAPGQQGDLSKHANCRQSPNGIFGGMRPALDHPARKDNSTNAARFFYCAKASKSDRGEGNTHPTVKPQALMRYLCRLVTPPGGTVLDCYAGSGSTGVASLSEEFKAVLVEQDPTSFNIAVGRITTALLEAH